MPTMADSVDWQAIPADVAAVAGYIDGARYPWPADAWAHFAGRHVLRVSVLADPSAPAFDAEPGNASNEAVAVAVAVRAGRTEPSVVYTNAANLRALTAALALKGFRWHPVGSWPEPGPYLWAAAPGEPPGSIPRWCPVEPVAVQDRWLETYDLSTLRGGWLPPLEPEPAPSPAPATPAPADPHPAWQKGPAGNLRAGPPTAWAPLDTYEEALALFTRGARIVAWTLDTDRPAVLATLDELSAVHDPSWSTGLRYALWVQVA